MQALYNYILMCCLFFSLTLKAQKEREQQLQFPEMEKVFIEADEVFEIHLKTVKENQVTIKTHAEGIYAQQLSIAHEIKGNALYINSVYPKNLVGGYDKLSATKVFVVNLTITVPENKKVVITSNLASLKAEGKYMFFEVELTSGNCMLKNFTGQAVINTYTGNIFIETPQAEVDASSRNGEVEIGKNIPLGKKITAKSIDGDIIITKSF